MPPCTQKTRLLIRTATGIKLSVSQKVRQSLTKYLRWHLSKKTIETIDGGYLVVAPKDVERSGVEDFEGKEKADDFERLAAAVNVITKKEVFVGEWEADGTEDAQKVVKVPVNVTANSHGAMQLEET